MRAAGIEAHDDYMSLGQDCVICTPSTWFCFPVHQPLMWMCILIGDPQQMGFGPCPSFRGVVAWETPQTMSCRVSQCVLGSTNSPHLQLLLVPDL